MIHTYGIIILNGFILKKREEIWIMMQKITCTYCKKEWYIEEHEVYKADICPFCKSRLSDDVCEIESLGQAVFSYIRKNGHEVLNQPEVFFAELGQLFPEDEKAIRIFSNILRTKEIEKLKEAFEEENGVEKIRQLSLDLIENMGLDQKWAEKFRNEFSAAVKDYDALVMKWVRREKRMVSANMDWGDRYKYGKGAQKSYEKAIEYYEKAAKFGYAPALNKLGDMYRYGKGASKSYEANRKAVEYYKQAAEQGDADAQKNLGDMYYRGRGVTQSYSEAKNYYQQAADQGHHGAKQALKNMLYANRG